MAKKGTICSKIVDFDNQTVTFHFAHGTEVVVSLSDFDAAGQAHLAVDGIRHTLGDSYASAETSQEAEERLKAKLEAALTGDWTVRTSEGTPRVSITVEALARVRNISTDQALELWNGLDEAKRKAVAAVPAIKSTVLDIRRERLSGEEGSDLDSVLAG